MQVTVSGLNRCYKDCKSRGANKIPFSSSMKNYLQYSFIKSKGSPVLNLILILNTDAFGSKELDR